MINTGPFHDPWQGMDGWVHFMIYTARYGWVGPFHDLWQGMDGWVSVWDVRGHRFESWGNPLFGVNFK